MPAAARAPVLSRALRLAPSGNCSRSPSRRLRLTESPGDEILKKPRDPCSTRPTEISRAPLVLDVLNGYLESRRLRMARSLVRHTLNFESKIGGRKSEANNFCRKRELVATGNQ